MFAASHPFRCAFVFAATLILALTALTGCGTLHGSAQVGPDLKPRLGTSISVPLGK